MIPPHLFYQIYLSFLEQNDCTPPKCGELSEYTDSAHTEVEDLSSRYINRSNVYDRCGHDTRLLHPSCTACRRTANLPSDRCSVIMLQFTRCNIGINNSIRKCHHVTFLYVLVDVVTEIFW